ncbi:MAG: hypothetical protein HC892_20630 [Saprospiraceae bacterium]|nr:hypothetical protein [Saprospiraceae bacterium]
MTQEEWIESERNNLQEQFLIVLGQLTEGFTQEEQYETALSAANKMIQLDNCLENAHRAMMYCYWKMGDRIRALRQFEQCKLALKRELGINVSAKTLKLMEEIQEG